MEERELLSALRAGDEGAFASLVERYSAPLLRVAVAIVGTRAVAEEVVQETWLGFLTGLDRFEGRASLKTWLFRILTNSAKTRAARERRSVPFSALAAAEASADERAVDADRFLPADHDRWPGHWTSPPRSWADTPERRLLGAETRRVVTDAIERLPEAQRVVITLRDVAGWSGEEVCAALAVSDGNQRVLLHRARSRVRAALEDYLTASAAEPALAGAASASSATST
jgi:RNA polymerase sigma-70 factor, ECF subfamily